MKTKAGIVVCVLVLISFIYTTAAHGEGPSPKKDVGSAPAVHADAVHTNDAETMRLQGEQRYHANCGRCHATPQKFPPRMMATVLRHMRVRATITDDDMRLVLFYMSQ